MNQITGISMSILLLILITLDYMLAIGVKAKHKSLTSSGMTLSFGKKMLLSFVPVIVHILIQGLDYYVNSFSTEDVTVIHWGMIIFTVVMLIQEWVSISAYLKLLNPRILKILEDGASTVLPLEVVNKAKKAGIISEEDESEEK